MFEDVELCLEVQMDPASKKILTHPEKCRSMLLDVTVVKPKETEPFGIEKTNTLRADQVRKLISSMEKQRREKQKLIENLKFDDTLIKVRQHKSAEEPCYYSYKPKYKEKKVTSRNPVDNLEKKDFIGVAESVEPLFCEIRRSLKNVETRITNMQDINLVISQTTTQATASEDMVYRRRKARSLPSGEHLRNNQVYRSDKAVHDLKSVLLCRNKDKYLNNNEKVGKCLCENCGIVGLLMECQKHPLISDFSGSGMPELLKTDRSKRKKARFEDHHHDTSRINSETLPSINYLTRRIQLLEERLAEQEERLVSKDYFKKIITRVVANFTPKKVNTKSDMSVYFSEIKPKKDLRFTTERRSVGIQEKLRTHHEPIRRPTYGRNEKSTLTDDELYYSTNIWRWGEEILKPGIDLKNRIITLINDILTKFTMGERWPAAKNSPYAKDEARGPRATAKLSNYYNSDSVKRFINNMNAKMFNSYDNNESQVNKNAGCCRSDIPDRPKSSPQSRVSREWGNKNVDISYMNPKMSPWKGQNSGRQEFLKIISKARNSQKEVLWRNIWNQAKANGQTKDDLISIKIPANDGKRNPDIIETELTIKEVEELLTKNL